MGWFSDRSLRAQWRLAQVFVGLWVAIPLVAWVVTLLFAPSSALAWAKAALAQPAALLPAVAATGFVLWVDRHLAKTAPAAGPPSEPPQST